jgi:hypothetical protein
MSEEGIIARCCVQDQCYTCIYYTADVKELSPDYSVD